MMGFHCRCRVRRSCLQDAEAPQRAEGALFKNKIKLLYNKSNIQRRCIPHWSHPSIHPPHSGPSLDVTAGLVFCWLFFAFVSVARDGLFSLFGSVGAFFPPSSLRTLGPHHKASPSPRTKRSIWTHGWCLEKPSELFAGLRIKLTLDHVRAFARDLQSCG